MELKIYTPEAIERYVERRAGEKKYGQYVQCAAEVSQALPDLLRQSAAEYVLLGIPENTGMQVSPEKKDAAFTWKTALKALLNTQHNPLNRGNRLYVLGQLDLEEETAIFNTLDLSDKEDLKKAGKLVEDIDKEVAHITAKIVASGKKPVVTGGGRNNAYGLIKGTALALSEAVNAVSLDAYSGFGPRKGRHSGNGFSHAFAEGFLQKYYILGLRENHISKALFKTLKKHERYVQYATFEDIEIERKKSFLSHVNHALAYMNKDPFGIEIDFSALSPDGFSANQARRFVTTAGKHQNAQYLHISGAAPDAANEREMERTGTLIAYLITDFIKHNTSVTF